MRHSTYDIHILKITSRLGRINGRHKRLENMTIIIISDSYFILEMPNIGLIINTTTQIYTIVKPLKVKLKN